MRINAKREEERKIELDRSIDGKIDRPINRKKERKKLRKGDLSFTWIIIFLFCDETEGWVGEIYKKVKGPSLSGLAM